MLAGPKSVPLRSREYVCAGKGASSENLFVNAQLRHLERHEHAFYEGDPQTFPSARLEIVTVFLRVGRGSSAKELWTPSSVSLSPFRSSPAARAISLPMWWTIIVCVWGRLITPCDLSFAKVRLTVSTVRPR